MPALAGIKPFHIFKPQPEKRIRFCTPALMIYCNYCPGYCCYRLAGSTLLITGTDINRMALYLGISDGEVRRRYLEGKNTFKVREDGSCILQAPDRMTKRCTIHEARPDQCRRFPYAQPCPYLHREELLAEIQPKIEKGLCQAWDRRNK